MTSENMTYEMIHDWIEKWIFRYLDFLSMEHEPFYLPFIYEINMLWIKTIENSTFDLWSLQRVFLLLIQIFWFRWPLTSESSSVWSLCMSEMNQNTYMRQVRIFFIESSHFKLFATVVESKYWYLLNFLSFCTYST